MFLVHARGGQARATKVIVLQHSNEVSRRSATAPLLFDGGDESGDDISQHLSAKRWIWSGRKDNEEIQQFIEEIEKYDGIVPALLWTGTGAGQSIDETDPADPRYRRISQRGHGKLIESGGGTLRYQVEFATAKRISQR